MPPDPDPARWARVSAAFDAAADLAPADRPAALDRLCRDADGRADAALRAEVESLLDADADATTSDDALDHGPLDASVLLEAAPVVGERIGPWRVLRPIGRGGMGRVDLVERADGAYDQRAALKRLGLVAPARVRRFLRERQILATLDHPGIARLLDGGVADDGAPYLVMEYVEGEPITAYADRRALGLRARLRLFLQVCDAVAFAHRHLVVHRDLKPSNVLVGEVGEDTGTGTDEADGVPHGARATLLDFGIARLLDADTDEPLTAEGPGAPLSPGYAAPEQVAGEPVTTATDVYALGVLLYELIAGRRPIEAGTRQAWADAVLQTSPTAPSQSVADPTDARRLRGDLDAIALTALRREPEARYASASDLAADLRRYLAGEPVQARAPSVGYRARRFVGRHRTAVAAAALVALAVVAGGAATAWQARQARASAAESAATADFLAGLFQGADPTASGDSLLALDLLRRGADRIDAELAGQPGARARLGLVVGDAYLGLGQPDSAAAFARRTLALRQPGGAAPDAVEAVRARILLGRALFPTDPTAAADALAAAVADARTTGDDAVLLDALEAQGGLVGGQVLDPGETVAVLEEAVALCRRVEGDASPRLGRLLATFATKASSAHQHGRVEGLWRDALALLPAETAPYDRSAALLELGKLLAVTGQPDEARASVDEALALRRRLLGPDDARTAEALAVRANVGTGGPAQAEADAREALRIAERTGDGAVVIEALDALGSALTAQERFDDAVEVYRRRFERAAEVYGTEGTRYPAASGTLARALHRAGRYAEARRAWDESLRLTTAAYGPESAVVAAGLIDAAGTAEAAGDAGRASRLFERAYVASRGLQPSSRTRAIAALRLGRAHLEAGRASQAVGPLREAVGARETLDRVGGHGGRAAGPSDGVWAEALLGEALVASGATEEGHRFLSGAVPALTAALGADHPDVRRARAAMAQGALRGGSARR
ncbi:protein kinase domain-containing protein [Rubrivirga sp.]|uniref:protein kinase domain-containing protein n=1 Tax=Rubrivirga sp. TaxID=1885344 RepID=UPI003B52ED5A